MEILATLFIGVGLSLSLLFLWILSKKGWIDLPTDSNAVKLLAIGVLLIAIIPIATLSEGRLTTVFCWGIIILFGLVGFLVGFTYYKKNQGKTEVQKLDLDE